MSAFAMQDLHETAHDLHRGSVAPAPKLPPRVGRLLEEPELLELVDAFRGSLPTDGLEGGFGSAIRQALDHPGSLLRAQIAWGIMTRCDGNVASARRVATAIEYFHTASLIFDDMPSMDDATMRRGQPCVHVAFGEASATLGALALINRAYAFVWEALAGVEPSRASRAASVVATCLGARGVLNGQALDLTFDQQTRSADDVLRAAEGKTVSLIRLTLVLPALLSGVSDTAITELEELAREWGLAYQILDDFKDRMFDSAEAGKTVLRDAELHRPSLPGLIGDSKAFDVLNARLDRSRTIASTVDVPAGARELLARLQAILDEELDRIEQRLDFRTMA